MIMIHVNRKANFYGKYIQIYKKYSNIYVDVLIVGHEAVLKFVIQARLRAPQYINPCEIRERITGPH